jgi:DMSO/TMAO reductase YedYZ molybdopterin-dependent catalytic subunit
MTQMTRSMRAGIKAAITARMSLLRAVLAGAALACLAAGAQAGAKVDDPSRHVTETVAIKGAVEHALLLGVADLRQFPPRQIAQLPLISQSGAQRGRLTHLKGVLLRDILARASIVAPGHNDAKNMVVIASASDGYSVVFSWSEIVNSPLGDGIIVFYEKDGQALPDDEGRIAMVSAQDIRTGPRHVKWLQAIEVRKIAP